MENVWVPIIVAIIMSPPLYGLVRSIIKTVKGRNDKEDGAWLQRDSQRKRADILHEALMKTRSNCHVYHVHHITGERIQYEDMPDFPGR